VLGLGPPSASGQQSDPSQAAENDAAHHERHAVVNFEINAIFGPVEAKHCQAETDRATN
jgi:hypothetical protein